MMVVGGPGQTEAALQAGQIPCPNCSARAQPHSYARMALGVNSDVTCTPILTSPRSNGRVVSVNIDSARDATSANRG